MKKFSSSRISTGLGTACLAALSLTALAQEAAEKEPAGKADPAVSLTGPFVQKVSQDMRDPSVADLDGDGRSDLIAIDNSKGEITFLLQRNQKELQELAREKIETDFWEPILDTAPFFKQEMRIGDRMFSLATLDFNQDGRLDFAVSGLNVPLRVFYQQEGTRWREAWRYDQVDAVPAQGCIIAEDLDGDGGEELLFLGKGKLIEFRFSPDGKANRPKVYSVGQEDARDLAVVDIDGDGRKDLLYLLPSSDRPRVVRLGQEGGGFGAEIEITGELGAIDYAVKGDQDGTFAFVDEIDSEVIVGRFSTEEETATAISSLQARSYPVPRTGAAAAIPCVGDYDGDGIGDVVMGDAEGARVLLWKGQSQSVFQRPVDFPSYSQITSLAAVQSEGRDALLVVSGSEGIAGIASFDQEKGRFSFPDRVVTSGSPIVGGSGNIDADDSAEELLIVQKEGLRLELAIFRKKDAVYEEVDQVKIGSMKREPEHIIVEDITGDGRADVIVMVPKEPAHILIANEEGTLDVVAEDSTIRKGQFVGLSPVNFSIGDIDEDGRMEVLLAKKGFIRAYQIDQGGGITLKDQGNMREGNDVVLGPLVLPKTKDRSAPQLAAYHLDDESLQFLTRDGDGAFRYDLSTETGAILLTQATYDASAAGEKLFLFGRDRFWVLPLAGEALGFAEASRFSSRLDDVSYAALTFGDLAGDQQPELILIDPAKHVVEVLRQSEDEQWKSSLHFKVFERSRFARNKKDENAVNPRFPLIDDFNGDGKNDLLLFCHDKVLLYPNAR